MNLGQGILLGLIQGITEFLPVSSSGHLAIMKNLFGMQVNGSLLFDIMLHTATLFAVVFVFRKDLLRMAAECIHMCNDLISNIRTFVNNYKNHDARRYKRIIHNNYRRYVAMVIVSATPTAIIGYTARELVSLAGQSLLFPGVCLILTACMLLIADVVESGKKIPKDITLTNAFMIGIAQGFSVLPGLSRSGMTITASLMSGFDRRFAVQFSFIMSIPAIIGALILEITHPTGEKILFTQVLVYLVSSVIACGAGYFCIRKMLILVRKKKFKGFAIYCFLIGIVAIAGHFAIR